MGKNKDTSVLIIEDSIVQAQALKNILDNEYNVTCTHSGNDGLKALHVCSYTVVLLDMILPDMNGIDILKEMKEDPIIKNIPVIIITSLTDRQTEEKGLMYGAIDYVTKPFIPELVRARVANHVRLRSYTVELEKLTMIDPLTRIGNRRYFDLNSKSAWNRCIRSKEAMSICMFDIDYFKAYNDTYGHPEGDKVLALVANVINKSFKRGSDLVARYGGEEFIAVITGGESGLDYDYLNVVRNRIEELKIKHGTDKQPYITVSIGGVTVHPRRSEHIEDFIKVADEMLYKSKQSGRNRVTWTDDRMELLSNVENKNPI